MNFIRVYISNQWSFKMPSCKYNETEEHEVPDLEDFTYDGPYPTCPYCHKEVLEPEDLNLEVDVVDMIECKSCLKKYRVLPSVEISYFTQKME